MARVMLRLFSIGFLIVAWGCLCKAIAQPPLSSHRELFLEAHNIENRWNEPILSKVYRLRERVNQAIAAHPENHELRLLLAFLLFQLREYEEAVRIVDTINPDKLPADQQPVYYLYLCHGHWQIGNIHKVFPIFLQSVLETLGYSMVISFLIFLMVFISTMLKSNDIYTKISDLAPVFLLILINPLLFVAVSFAVEILVSGAPMIVHTGDRARASVLAWLTNTAILWGEAYWLGRRLREQSETAQAKWTQTAFYIGIFLFAIIAVYAFYNARILPLSQLLPIMQVATVPYWVYTILSLSVGLLALAFFIRGVYIRLRQGTTAFTALGATMLLGALTWWLVGPLPNTSLMPLLVLSIAASVLLYEKTRSWLAIVVPQIVVRMFFHLYHALDNMGRI